MPGYIHQLATIQVEATYSTEIVVTAGLGSLALAGQSATALIPVAVSLGALMLTGLHATRFGGIVTISDCRGVIVGAEDRIIDVEAEDRIVDVPAEDRIIDIGSCDDE